MDCLTMHRAKKVEVKRGISEDGKTHYLDLVITKESGARVGVELFSNKYIALNFEKTSKKKGQ